MNLEWTKTHNNKQTELLESLFGRSRCEIGRFSNFELMPGRGLFDEEYFTTWVKFISNMG